VERGNKELQYQDHLHFRYTPHHAERLVNPKVRANFFGYLRACRFRKYQTVPTLLKTLIPLLFFSFVAIPKMVANIHFTLPTLLPQRNMKKDAILSKFRVPIWIAIFNQF
jgi:hypothetical protein